MKEFEKWNKENKAYLPLLDNTIANERYKGWFAALEWAQNRCDELDEACCLDCGCFGMVFDTIEDELNG